MSKPNNNIRNPSAEFFASQATKTIMNQLDIRVVPAVIANLRTFIRIKTGAMQATPEQPTAQRIASALASVQTTAANLAAIQHVALFSPQKSRAKSADEFEALLTSIPVIGSDMSREEAIAMHKSWAAANSLDKESRNIG